LSVHDSSTWAIPLMPIGSLLPGLGKQEPPLGPTSKWAEIFRHIRNHRTTFENTSLCPPKYSIVRGWIVFWVWILIILLLRSLCKISEPYGKPFWDFSNPPYSVWRASESDASVALCIYVSMYLFLMPWELGNKINLPVLYSKVHYSALYWHCFTVQLDDIKEVGKCTKGSSNYVITLGIL
jgi:hypothetical protein